MITLEPHPGLPSVVKAMTHIALRSNFCRTAYNPINFVREQRLGNMSGLSCSNSHFMSDAPKLRRQQSKTDHTVALQKNHRSIYTGKWHVSLCCHLDRQEKLTMTAAFESGMNHIITP